MGLDSRSLTSYIQYNIYKKFFHHPMADVQPVPEQRSRTPQIFANFMKYWKKDELWKKFELPDHRGYELMENNKSR